MNKNRGSRAFFSQYSFDVGLHAQGKAGQIIASFEDGHESATADFLGNFSQASADELEVFNVHFEPRQRIGEIAIKARGNEDDVRTELFDPAGGFLGEELSRIDRERRSFDGEVQRGSDASSVSFFPDRSGSRIKGWGAVNRQIGNRRIGKEDVLGSVSVVSIEIEDRDVFEPLGSLQVTGNHGDVVEETEAHRLVPSCVMAGRPCEDKGLMLPRVGHRLLGSLHQSSNGTARNVV